MGRWARRIGWFVAILYLLGAAATGVTLIAICENRCRAEIGDLMTVVTWPVLWTGGEGALLRGAIGPAAFLAALAIVPLMLLAGLWLAGARKR